MTQERKVRPVSMSSVIVPNEERVVKRSEKRVVAQASTFVVCCRRICNDMKYAVFPDRGE